MTTDNAYLQSLTNLWKEVRFVGVERFKKFEGISAASKELVGRMSTNLREKVWSAAKQSGWEAQFSAKSSIGSLSQSLPDENTSELNRRKFVALLEKI